MSDMKRGLVRVSSASAAVLAASLAMAAPPAGLPATMRWMDGPVRESGMVGFLDPATVRWQPFKRWPGVDARILGEDPATGRLAVQARFPAGWRGDALPAPEQSLEVVMLEGALAFGAEELHKYDFGFVPPGVAPPALASATGARALLFFDPPAPDAAAVQRQRERGAYVSRFDTARWQPASVAKSAGATADLKVMHLKKDPFTSARTWYVRLEGGMKVPWEVHSMAEEGVLMEGRYRLAECLPRRTVIGEYGAEGYFWRPGGIAHSGPESGPPAGGATAIWLQRSPIALDVVFYGGCADGKPDAPVQQPPPATRPSARYVDGRVLPLVQGSNFRDIGGYLTVDGRHVKWGRLFRSGGTPLLTEDDLETVRSLGLKHMVDLRSSEERSLAPSRIEGVEYNAMGYSIAAMVAAARRDPAAAPDPGAAYRMFPSSLGPQLRMIVKLLLADEAPLVYNCSAGQDRTGFVTAMLLSALGVPRDTILEDYHLSTRYRHPRYEMPAIDVAAHPGNAAALIWGSYQKDPGYDTPRPLRAPDGTSLLAYSFAEIERRWGTVDRYLAEEAGVSTLDIIRLRSLYLE